MFERLKQSLITHWKEKSRVVRVRWVRKDPGTFLARLLPGVWIRPRRSRFSHTIERLARETNEGGARRFWEGYAGTEEFVRSVEPDRVRTAAAMGDLFTHLVRQGKPRVVVEFGTAFGVSGMYFLAGLSENDAGRLLGFEPNAEWAEIARRNLRAVSDRFELTVGTFEDTIDDVLPASERIDLAFIDAIHTPEFVVPQLEMVLERSRSGTVVLLDDVNFSPEMQACWQSIASDRRFAASGTLGGRVGIVEVA